MQPERPVKGGHFSLSTPRRLPRLKIGWFLHTPWPSSEVSHISHTFTHRPQPRTPTASQTSLIPYGPCALILQVFRMLPMRRELLQGLLGADLLGFHIYEYARHFLHACLARAAKVVSRPCLHYRLLATPPPARPPYAVRSLVLSARVPAATEGTARCSYPGARTCSATRWCCALGTSPGSGRCHSRSASA